MTPETDTGSRKVIEDFIRKLNRRKNSKLARSIERDCKALLKDAEPKILANFNYRAKHKDSLRKKLLKVNLKLQDSRNGKGFQNDREVSDSIVDLAGVRIAVFFPEQQRQVEEIIEKEFEKEDGKFKKHSIIVHNVQTEQEEVVSQGAHQAWSPPGTKDFGQSVKRPVETENSDESPAEIYKRRFQGYTAKHYRVLAKLPSPATDDSDSDSDDELAEARFIVEIQVVTALMIAWAEVEHDIIYKKIFGDPSGDESRLLDCLRGITLTGDLTLEHLGKAYFGRIEAPKKRFQGVGALLSFLDQSKVTKAKSQQNHAEALLSLLRIFDRDTPERLGKILETLKEPDPALDKIWSEFKRFRPSPALFVMINILHEEREKLAEAFEEQRRNEVHSEDTYRCKVLVNSLLWLVSDLFNSQDRIEVLFDRHVEEMRRDEKTFNGLAWAIQGAQRADIIGGKQPEDYEREHIESLWRWFQQCEEPVISFVFAISRLGIQKLKTPVQAFQIEEHRMYSDCLRVNTRIQRGYGAQGVEEEDTENAQEQTEISDIFEIAGIPGAFPGL